MYNKQAHPQQNIVPWPCVTVYYINFAPGDSEIVLLIDEHRID